LELDRHFIERNDFSATRRGYDPDEVDRHLREIGDAVAELKRQQRPSPSSLASAAAEQVRSIVEAAEKSAADIQAQAEDEARRITADASQRARETRERADADAVDRVSKAEDASNRMLERANGVEGEIDSLLANLRSAASTLVDNLNGGANSLQTELESFRAEFAGIRESRLEPTSAEGARFAEPDVAAEPEVAPMAEPEAEAYEEAAPPEPEAVEEPAADIGADTAVIEPEPEAVPEPEPAPEPPAAEPGGRSIRGAEGARLIALNMALNGTPRDETARYLAQNFELDDQDALLDEVYARVGG